MSDNLEKHRANTRRWLALGIALPLTSTTVFMLLWGALNHQVELVMAGVGIGGTALGNVMGYYFGKKAKEE